MKKITQFRYYGFQNTNNYPRTLSYSDLITGNIFRSLGLVLQIGIQAMPGTQFYLNKSNYPITIGSTGIYELNLEGISSLFSIKFTKDSLDNIDSSGDGLIIDVLYEGAGI